MDIYTAGYRKFNTRKDKRWHNKVYFVDNMLTKYQMIKFIDFCEVWFLPESVARVVTIIGYYHCHTPLLLIKKDFRCVLGVQLTKNLPHVASGDLVWQLGVKSRSIVEQPLTTCFQSTKDPESEPVMEAIKSGD
ncbi:hypothetical protein TNCV_1470751 [Trichonephila clavipes]|nr:hypothetical protein TNCV_1470751 [Trichonephila clavipes]